MKALFDISVAQGKTFGGSENELNSFSVRHCPDQQRDWNKEDKSMKSIFSARRAGARIVHNNSAKRRQMNESSLHLFAHIISWREQRRRISGIFLFCGILGTRTFLQRDNAMNPIFVCYQTWADQLVTETPSINQKNFQRVPNPTAQETDRCSCALEIRDITF